jgi:hypothetical protein
VKQAIPGVGRATPDGIGFGVHSTPYMLVPGFAKRPSHCRGHPGVGTSAQEALGRSSAPHIHFGGGLALSPLAAVSFGEDERNEPSVTSARRPASSQCRGSARGLRPLSSPGCGNGQSYQAVECTVRTRLPIDQLPLSWTWVAGDWPPPIGVPLHAAHMPLSKWRRPGEEGDETATGAPCVMKKGTSRRAPQRSAPLGM